MEHLLQYVEAFVDEFVAVGDLAGAEQAAEELGRALSARVVQRLAASTAGRASYQGPALPCGCGGKARFMGYRGCTVVTVCGRVQVRRAYYHCLGCGSGYLPWDEAQGLGAGYLSPSLKALVAEVAVQMPYGEGMRLLGRLRGVAVEESTAERTVAELGARARADEAQRMAASLTGEVSAERAPQRLVVEMDGTSGHIDGAWHEVKSAVVWSTDQGAAPRRYAAAQEPAERFGERVYALAAETGVEQAAEVVCLGDGAEWIDNQFAHHFPQAVRVLDIWHAREHIWTVARVHWGEDSELGGRWAEEHCRRLVSEGPEPLLHALAALRPKTEEAARVIRRERAYSRQRREQMRYPEFLARGIPISSGRVEAGCKVLVGQRLKRAGMRWSAAGADAILALRCLVLNGDHKRIQAYARAA